MTFQVKQKFQLDMYEPIKEYHEPWLGEEHSMDQVFVVFYRQLDDYGFEKEESEKVDLFQFKFFDIPEFPRNEYIKQLAVGSLMILVITKSNRIFRWRPEREAGCHEMDLPDSGSVGLGQKLFSVGSALISAVKKPFDDRDKKDSTVIERVFMDPKGLHAILCTDQGDNFYINYREQKIKYCQGVRGKIIRSIAWSDQCTEDQTKDILMGTKDGKILLTHFDLRQSEFLEWEAKLMVSIPNERQINQLEYFSLNLEPCTLIHTIIDQFSCIIASTNFSIFFFFGANELEIAFNKYKDSAAVMRAESPPVRSHTSLMSMYYAKNKPHSFLFTNGKSLNLFKLPDKSQTLNEQFVNSSVYMKYAKRDDLEEKKSYEVQDMPIAVGLTEFHYFLLHSDCLTIVSRITEKVVKYYDAQMRQMGHLLDMIYVRDTEEFWIYSDRAVGKLVVANEDRDAWKLLMEKKKYTEAYEVGKKYQSGFTDYIAGLCGDQLYQRKEYTEAAQYYLRSSKSFEEIFLIFITSEDPQARIGLEYYLKRLLNTLKSDQQRTLVLSFLTELYIYRSNQQERLFYESRTYDNEQQRQKDLKEKQQQLKELASELTSFLQLYNNELDKETVYQIMQSHGRINNCVEFAKQNSNFEMIILHHINEENYKEAINNLRKVQDKNSMEVIQKYSHILMKFEPEMTLQLLMQHIKKFDPTKIIGGLMNIPEDKRRYGIQFLEHSIKNLDCKDKSIHNILIFFLTQPPDLRKLQGYLNEQERFLIEREKVNFDLDFALRLFSGSNLIEPQITIYGMMGLFTESVQLALQFNLIEKAKDYARRPADDDDKKKKLWMLIATHLLQKNDENIDDVIQLTKETDLIKIEDLLPYFNQNIKIEHFKDEICNSLKNYNEEIEKLKEEMKRFSQNSEQLKNELKMIKNKFLIIDTQQKCEHCFKHLFNDAFYLFPCNHGFHKECIVEKMKGSPLDPIKLQEIDRLNNLMMQIIAKSNQNAQRQQNQQQGGAFFTLMNIFGAGKAENKQQSYITNEEGEMLKKSKEQFDLMVASECVLCGPSIVDSIQLGFELLPTEKDSWAL